MKVLEHIPEAKEADQPSPQEAVFNRGKCNSQIRQVGGFRGCRLPTYRVGSAQNRQVGGFRGCRLPTYRGRFGPKQASCEACWGSLGAVGCRHTGVGSAQNRQVGGFRGCRLPTYRGRFGPKTGKLEALGAVGC